MPTVTQDAILIDSLERKVALAEKAVERAKKKVERRARLEIKGVSNPGQERSEVEEYGQALYDLIKNRLLLEDAREDAGKPESRRKSRKSSA